MWLVPYGFAFLVLYLLRFAPVVVQTLVVKYEPNKGQRLWVEQACLYTTAVSTLLSFLVTSWVAAMVKAGELVIRVRSDSSVALLIATVILFMVMLYVVIRYIRGITPHDFETPHGGLWGMSVKNSLRVIYSGGILLSLLVDLTARFLGDATATR